MRSVPLESDTNIAVNGPFWVEVANVDHPFTATFISCSGGTCLIAEVQATDHQTIHNLGESLAL